MLVCQSWSKKPYDANRILHEGDWNQFCYASSNDSGTWCSYKTAVSVFLKRRKSIGIGFAFAEGDGLVGIDLDNCVDPDTGVITDERVKRILKQFKGAYVDTDFENRFAHHRERESPEIGDREVAGSVWSD